MHHHHRSHKRRSLAAPLLVVIIALVVVGIGASLVADVKPPQQLVEKELDAKAFLQ